MLPMFRGPSRDPFPSGQPPAPLPLLHRAPSQPAPTSHRHLHRLRTSSRPPLRPQHLPALLSGPCHPSLQPRTPPLAHRPRARQPSTLRATHRARRAPLRYPRRQHVLARQPTRHRSHHRAGSRHLPCRLPAGRFRALDDNQQLPASEPCRQPLHAPFARRLATCARSVNSVCAAVSRRHP